MLHKRREYHEGETLLIKYYRLTRDMSQGDLAIACHVQKEFITQLEAGQNITRDTRITLARALQIEPWKLCKFNNLEKLKQTVQKLDRKFKKKRAGAKRQRRKKKVFRKRK